MTLLEQIRAAEMPDIVKWPTDQPPCDCAAESAVLNMLLLFPERMGVADLGHRLYFPEHRTIWQAMVRVYMRTPRLATVGEWWIALRHELHAICCPEKLLDECRVGTVWQPFCQGFRTWQVLRPGRDPRARWNAFDYWLERLDRCVEARQLIGAAQEQAERAWRGDLEGARQVQANVLIELNGTGAPSVSLADLDV